MSGRCQRVSNSSRGSTDRKKCMVHFTIILSTLSLRCETTTCSVSKTALGGNASVECAFAQDIENNSNIVVYLYTPKFRDSSTDTQVHILSCTFSLQHNISSCQRNGSKTVDFDVSSNILTFPLYKVSLRDAGDYSCQIRPVDAEIKVCGFAPDTQQPASQLSTLATQSSPTDSLPQTLQSSASENGKLATIICALIAGLILVIVIVVIVWCAIKRKRRKQREIPQVEIFLERAPAADSVTLPMACTEDHPGTPAGNTPDGLSVLEPLLDQTAGTGKEAEKNVIQTPQLSIKMTNSLKPATAKTSHSAVTNYKGIAQMETTLSECASLTEESSEMEVDRLLFECRKLECECRQYITCPHLLDVSAEQSENALAFNEKLQTTNRRALSETKRLENLQKTFAGKRLKSKIKASQQQHMSIRQEIETFLINAKEICKGLWDDDDKALTTDLIVDNMKKLVELDCSFNHYITLCKKSTQTNSSITLAEYSKLLQDLALQHEAIKTLQSLEEDALSRALEQQFLRCITDKTLTKDEDESCDQEKSYDIKDVAKRMSVFMRENNSNPEDSGVV